MSIPSFTSSQHPIKLPDEIKERALRWVQFQAATSHRKPIDAPFKRLIDFWFAAIAWAVHKGISPAEAATGPKFVSVGPNPNDLRNFDEWRRDLLVLLSVAEFGHEDDRSQDPAAVIDLANRYAEAGAPRLLEELDKVEEFAVPSLYRIVDLFVDEYQASTESSRTPF